MITFWIVCSLISLILVISSYIVVVKKQIPFDGTPAVIITTLIIMMLMGPIGLGFILGSAGANIAKKGT